MVAPHPDDETMGCGEPLLKRRVPGDQIHFDEKVRIMAIYESKFGEFPFPRSEQAIHALAAPRQGSSSGSKEAEASSC